MLETEPIAQPTTPSVARNLAHFGCLLGLITGLSIGIFVAWALIVHSVTTVLALLFWGVLTIVLGSIGYWIGSAVSPRRNSSTVV